MHEALAVMAMALISSGCASVSGTPPVRFAEVPRDALTTGWGRAHIDAATRAVFRALVTDGVIALRRGRLALDAARTPLSRVGIARAERAIVGLRPRASERRWAVLRRIRSGAVAGWCARGVSLPEPDGPEGFAQRALTVERLLVIADDVSGRWGFWLEGLALDGATWRWLPWVSWADAVETPRGAHTDIAMWSCELSSPPISGSGSPAR